MLERGVAIDEFSFHVTRPFERTLLVWYQVWQVGFHIGGFYWNKPRCQHYGKQQEIACPMHKEAHYAHSKPIMDLMRWTQMVALCGVLLRRHKNSAK